MSLHAVEAIVVALRAVPAVTVLLPAGASGIAMGLLPPGTPTPYIAVHDTASEVAYAFGNAEKYTAEMVDVYVYAEDGEAQSAPSVARQVLDAVRAALHNNEISYDGRRFLSLRYGGDRPASWQMMTSQERYFRAGIQLDGMTGPL